MGYFAAGSFNLSVAYLSGQLNATFDIEKYIRQHLGDRVIPYGHLLTVVYGSLFVFGLFGNFSTICLLLIWNRSRNWNGIDPYVMNLALTDLVQTLVSLPLEIYKYWNQYPWVFGQFICSSIALLAEAALCSSILTIIAFTIERFIAVVHPMKAYRSYRGARPWKTILLCWLLAIVNSVPFAYYHNVNVLQSPDGIDIAEASWCAIHYNLNAQLAPLFLYSAVTFYAVPMLLLIVLHLKIWIVVQKRALAAKEEEEAYTCPPSPPFTDPNLTFGTIDLHLQAAYSKRPSRLSVCSRTYEQHCQSNKRLFYGLLAIVINFFLCYGLFHAQRLMFALVDWNDREEARKMYQINSILFPVSGKASCTMQILPSIPYCIL
ncbi:neuropeptides capa receptor-like isoform X2 [Paramacrobiotus metropolitanus]|uniref:neuropeptides capa receptor-like isoform X2 n=1 Tax=Paramacrobiotus metropolitanus TaxID=2943436 RepID=UPI002445EF31|nr:neuropeptides capa receptor-like isoform X2 [Paramacrobiotus metropolitanus]